MKTGNIAANKLVFEVGKFYLARFYSLDESNVHRTCARCIRIFNGSAEFEYLYTDSATNKKTKRRIIRNYQPFGSSHNSTLWSQASKTLLFDVCADMEIDKPNDWDTIPYEE